MIKLVKYNNSYWSMIRLSDELFYNKDIISRRRKFTKEFYEGVTDKDEIERISLSRSKSTIKSICLSNDFEYFATITVNSLNCDRFSLTSCQEKMKKICKKIQRKNKNFKYIYITEKHKDGAFHFHGMVKGLKLYKNNNGYFSNHDFDTLGYNSFSAIKSYNKCCNYITKYITKNCIKNEDNQIYFCSRGLNRGDTELMLDYDLEKIFLNKKIFKNEYCQKIDFDISTLSEQQRYNLYHFFNYNDELCNKYDNNITNLLQLLTKFNIKFNM